MLKIDLIGSVRRTITSPNVPVAAWRIKPGTGPKSWTADRDPYILETSVPGIFAAGDVRHGSTKRVAAAVGEGSSAVGIVHRYLASV